MARSTSPGGPPGHDAIVVGSGFGGAMAAHALVRAGLNVLMLERGGWVPRGQHNWGAQGSLMLSPFYSKESPYRVLSGAGEEIIGSCSCVGGPSVFYGGVSLRLRERDFLPDPDIDGESGARWPISYLDLEPYYTRAERILDVAGAAGEDPTEPFRSAPYSQPPAALSATAERIGGAARELGLKPFRLPLSINYASDPAEAGGRGACVSCATCDTYACAVQAKNDLATRVLPDLLGAGLHLQDSAVVTRLLVDRGRVTGVAWQDRHTGAAFEQRARAVVLAAGALGTPHLLLASGLDRHNPAGGAVGRYLTRHCNAIVFGVVPWRPAEGGLFHKQLGFHDFYFGHPAVPRPAGRLGVLQQVSSPPLSLALEGAPRLLAPLVRGAVGHMTGLLVMAEDQPRHDNHVAIDRASPDRFGLPGLTIRYRHAARDLSARGALAAQARSILRRAGALMFYMHEINTFSHAAGTVRMGVDPATSPLDADCQFRGVEGLHVVDGSALPRSGGVNPSLTIAANALRVGERVARTLGGGR